MKKPSLTLKPRKLRRLVVLLTGVSTVALVAGCGATSIKNPFSSGREEQLIDGGRRTPLLNQGDPRVAGQAPPPQVLVPSQTPPVPQQQPAVKQDSFDYYSAAAASVPQQEPASGQILGTLNPAPVRAETRPVRKPILGNMQHEALGQVQASGNVPPPSYTSVPSQAFDATAAEPVRAKPVASAPAKQASFFERVFGPATPAASEGSTPPWKSRDGRPSDDASVEHRDASEDALHNAPVAEEQNTPYPALSSVPAVPPQFNDIRAGRQQDVQDLQHAHTQALQEKQALGGEPSQQGTATPVEMPPPPPVQTQPAPESSPAVLGHASSPVEAPPAQYATPPAQPEPVVDNNGAPRSPRRGIDIMTQEEWEALQRARQQGQYPQDQNSQGQQFQQEPAPQTQLAPLPAAAPEPQPAESSVGDAQTTQESAPADASSAPIEQPAPTNRPNWWEGWGSSNTPVQQPPPPDQSGSPQSALPPVAEPVATAVADTEKSVTEKVIAVEETPSVQATEDASTKRPSFFSRLFGKSPKQAGTDNVIAESVDTTEAASTTSSAKETTDTSDTQPAWVREWLSKPPAEEAVADSEKPIEAEPVSAQQNLSTPPQIEKLTEKATPPAEPVAEPVMSEVKPVEASPQEKVPEKLTEKVIAEETKAVAEEPVAKETSSSTRDWLQSLVSDAIARPASEKEKAPDKALDKPLEAAVSDTLPEPVANVATYSPASGDSPQLIGQMTDKTMMNLARQPVETAPETKPEKKRDVKSKNKTRKENAVVDAAPLPPAPEAPAAETVVASEPVATPVVETAVQAEQEKQPSFLKRLFGDASKTEEAKTETVAETPAAEPAAPAVAEAVAPVEAEQEKRPSLLGRLFKETPKTDEAKTETMAEEPKGTVLPTTSAAEMAEIKPAAAAEPAPVEEGAKKPSLLSRLLGKSDTTSEEAPASAESAQPVATDSVISASAPVMQVTTGDAQPDADKASAVAAATANTPSALPSPQILKEIKMMPASRYSARRKAQQQQPAEY